MTAEMPSVKERLWEKGKTWILTEVLTLLYEADTAEVDLQLSPYEADLIDMGIDVAAGQMEASFVLHGNILRHYAYNNFVALRLLYDVLTVDSESPIPPQTTTIVTDWIFPQCFQGQSDGVRIHRKLSFAHPCSFPCRLHRMPAVGDISLLYVEHSSSPRTA